MAGRPRIGPLEAFREGLALARRAGMYWEQARRPATEAALAVVPLAEQVDERLLLRGYVAGSEAEGEWLAEERERIEQERQLLASVLHDTRTAWMRAFERRDTEVPGLDNLMP
jgi:uncharacterized membrane protein YebE (DUF533 family)